MYFAAFIVSLNGYYPAEFRRHVIENALEGSSFNISIIPRIYGHRVLETASDFDLVEVRKLTIRTPFCKRWSRAIGMIYPPSGTGFFVQNISKAFSKISPFN